MTNYWKTRSNSVLLCIDVQAVLFIQSFYSSGITNYKTRDSLFPFCALSYCYSVFLILGTCLWEVSDHSFPHISLTLISSKYTASHLKSELRRCEPLQAEFVFQIKWAWALIVFVLKCLTTCIKTRLPSIVIRLMFHGKRSIWSPLYTNHQLWKSFKYLVAGRNSVGSLRINIRTPAKRFSWISRRQWRRRHVRLYFFGGDCRCSL